MIQKASQASNRIRSLLLLISLKENNNFLKQNTKINSISSQQYSKQFESANVIMIQTYNVSSSQGSSIHKRKTGNILRVPTAPNANHGGSYSSSENKELKKKRIGKAKLKHSKKLIYSQGSETRISNNLIENESLLDKSYESAISNLSCFEQIEENVSKKKEARHYLKNLLSQFKLLKSKTKMCFRIISTDGSGTPSPNIINHQLSFKIPVVNKTNLSKDDFLSSSKSILLK